MSDSATTSRGFVFGRPVQPDEFLNRKSELRTILNRVRHGDSSAIVGEPHIGKTSLLLKLAHEPTRWAYLGEESHNATVRLLDLHPIGADYAPSAFWNEALEPLAERTDDSALPGLTEQAVKTGHARRALEKLFDHLGQGGHRLVLMLDEFERLLIHPNFQDPAFFALLRSLGTRTGGLVVITASRLSVAEMNERGRELLETGSPFFNNVIEIRLRPFDDVTVGTLLDQGGEQFAPDDRRFIRRVAGRHPFLLQAMAAAVAESQGEQRQAQAAERFYEWTTFHFDDLWRVLDDRTRTTAVILSLMELGGRALGQRFAYQEIERVDAFGPELRKLAAQGLAEQVEEGWEYDRQYVVGWKDERWTVGSQAFAWWVRDVIVAESRRVPAYDDWLANKRYRLLLTKEQWDALVTTLRGAPDWAVRGVGGLARALFQELAGLRKP